ncbi:TetR/AcrR family transcriptional repressor of nem operon [Prauserella sediminis]|uniref:TetR/AcrR family transcriptional repressor of nem operon n=1 Tax=Prauserella sediminis TaxID=577680 RepID=A0A839XHX7_9PSEU|nr:TetR/AcrR family transcriptional regulator [Prauserella sediminis]MBB3663572.1 TetR/AcrR family transcriptional repressor of nem operon [Prauserella sediminis]
MARTNVREKLIAAGLDVFHTQGFHGTSVQDITSAAGVPKGSFYNHFDGKEALAVATIHLYLSESPVQVLLDDSAGAPLDRLREHFDVLAQRLVDSEFTRGCIMGNFANEIADHSEPVRATLTAAFDAWTNLIAAVLAEAQEVGALSADTNTSDLANFIVNSWEGALTRARATKNAQSLRSFFDITFGVMLR